MFRDGSGVLLGVPGSSSGLKAAPDARTTRVGGDPIWHDESSPVNDQQRICVLCQAHLDFIMQVYAPTEVSIKLEPNIQEKCPRNSCPSRLIDHCTSSHAKSAHVR